MNTSRWIIAAAVMAMVAATGCQSTRWTGRQVREGLPVYHCRHVDEMPVIDGKLDDVAWKKAETEILRRAADSSVPSQSTVVRAVWTDTQLVIGFECADNDIWAGIREHDGDIYEQEVVEAFIDANGDQRSYVELEVSPANVVLDMYILNPGRRTPFKGMRDFELDGMQTAVTIEGTLARQATKGPGDDQRWVVEIAIPFDQFVLANPNPPRVGDVWWWNLYRIDRPGSAKTEYSAWSPPGENSYHRPDQFGALVFTDACKN